MEAEEVVRVVVTGGDVFKTFNFNSSLMVRGALPSRIDRAGKPPIVILKYPEGVLCSYDFVTNMMQKIWGGRAPEEISLALHMGMRDSHPEETTYCLEQLGHKTGYKQPGDDGRQFPEALIEEGGPWHELPDVLYSDFDLQATRSRIANALPEVKIEVSENAGLYFCEFQLYASLAELLKKGQRGKAAFLHVPVKHTPEQISTSVQVAVEFIKDLVESMGL